MLDLVKNPIFVVGGGRSGTSIMLKALGLFNEIIAAQGETPQLTIVAEASYNHFILNDRRGEYYRNSLKIQTRTFQRLLVHLAFRLTFGTANPFIAVLKFGHPYQSPFKMLRVNRWAAKTFPERNHASGLKAIFPGCQIIYMVRNALDVVGSRMKFKGFKSLEFEEHCISWKETVAKYEYVDGLSWGIVIRYEDFLADQACTLARIAGFLGCHGNLNGVVDYVKKNVLHPLDKPDQKVSDAAAFLSSRAEAWRSWNGEQKRAFADICTEGMNKLGYEIPF